MSERGPSIPQPSSLCNARSVARLASAAEKALTTTLGWLPYPSDLPDEQQSTFAHDYAVITSALNEARKARKWAEEQIISEAMAE